MSKTITKNQLKMVIESTIKESDYMMENKDELKLTKDHMDELHKEGHCMCDGKCLVYTEDIKGDDKKMSELLQKLASEKMDCVIVSKEQMDMLHKDGKCDCDNNVTLSYEDEMKEGDYMNYMGDDMKEESNFEVVDAALADMPVLKTFVKNVLAKKYDEDTLKMVLNVLNGRGTRSKDELRDIALKLAESDNMTEEMCNECGGTMVEGICEGGCGSMKEEDVDENFVLAADEAKDKGEKEFEYPKGSGKMHPVTIKADIKNEEKDKVEESVSELTESLSKTTNKEIMKEDMDFFNKMINYNKK
jgi:hypothetical protein